VAGTCPTCRLNGDAADSGRGRKVPDSETPCKFLRPRGPQIYVELRWQVRNRGRVPVNTLVHEGSVDPPPDAIGLPLDLVEVEVG
jgi:hypothetical protein